MCSGASCHTLNQVVPLEPELLPLLLMPLAEQTVVVGELLRGGLRARGELRALLC